MPARIWSWDWCFWDACRCGRQNPMAGDSKAAKAGEYEFRINCALCHGLAARRRRKRS